LPGKIKGEGNKDDDCGDETVRFSSLVRSEMDALIDHCGLSSSAGNMGNIDLSCLGHERYNWRHQEAILNKFPQFRCAIPITGFGMLRHHFLWHRTHHSGYSTASSVVTAASPLKYLPLVLVGEFWEYQNLFCKLSEEESAFDVVCPSVPGMGFSDPPASPAFGIRKAAEGLHKLMLKLGYSEYVVHGSGYLGFALARMLSLDFPRAVKGIHLTDLVIHPPSWSRKPGKMLKLQWGKLTGKPWARLTEAVAKNEELEDLMVLTGRLTWGYALTDSPMGLLSWVSGRLRKGITDKVWCISFFQYHLPPRFTEISRKHEWSHSEILSAFMYYWITGPSDFINLFDTAHKHGELDEVAEKWSPVPIGTYLPAERSLPKDYVALIGKLMFETKVEMSARWLAWEEPAALAVAVRGFQTKLSENENLEK
jgi:pimeloyl-ACP methyl ester carboxylesterase